MATPRICRPFRRRLLLLLTLFAAASPVALPVAADEGPAVTLSASAEGEWLTISLPPLRWSAVPGGVAPTMRGFGSLSEVGRPDLPARIERIALAGPGQIAIRDIRVEWLEGRIPGLLASYPAADPDRPDMAPEMLERDGFWPAAAVRVVTDRGAFRRIDFASLEIVPVQVDLTAGRFRVARRIEILLDRPGTSTRLKSGARAASMDGLESALGERLALGIDDLGPPAPRSWADGPTDADEPTYPAWQFTVASHGLHRVSYAWAQAQDPALLAFLTGEDPRDYRLSCQGTEIPILVLGEGDGSFDPGDAIVFYGQPVEGDPYDPDVWQGGDFTDINVYRLDVAAGPARVDELAAPPAGAPTPASFSETAFHDPPLRFQGFVPEDGVDHWYYYPWLNTDAGVGQVDLFVDTPGHVGGDVSLRARLLGFEYNNNLHRTEVLVDDELVDGCGDGDGGCVDWDGHIEFTHGEDQGPVVFAATLGPTTKVSVGTPLGRSGVTKDIVGVNWIELVYDRAYEALSDALIFTAENTAQEIHVDGYASAPEIWEISETVDSGAGLPLSWPTRLVSTSFAGGQARFEISADGGLPAERRFVSANAAGMHTPLEAREDLPPSSVDPQLGSSLRGAGLGADWIVIGERSLIFAEGSSTFGPELDALMARRSDPGGQGLATAVIDVQDVYDEFSHGIVDPQALREFLAYALGGGEGACAPNWDPAPAFVLLLGDASWDHKNNYGYDPDRQYVPVYMFDVSANTQFGYYPSDTWFAAVCGTDEIPDASVGRIPAHTFDEAETAFRKIREHEEASLPASVAGKALLISEWEDENGEFERVHDEIYDKWFVGQPQTAQKLYEAGPTQSDAEQLNADLDAAVNAGARMASYVGHGGYKDWGNGFDIFKTEGPETTDKDDQEDWLDGEPTFFTVHANCITGNFAATVSPSSTNDTRYSFLEDTLLTADKSVVAGFAPSHLTNVFELDLILDPIYEELFGRRKERLVGLIELMMRERFDSRNNEISLRSFILQGDPATRLGIPAPEAPAITSIDPMQSGELLVSWNQPDDPSIAYYRVFRSRVATGTYELAGTTPDASTTEFLDTGLRDCSEYFYYVVSVDDDGFESRWSNYNETCYGDRSDCWSGTPENPNLPSTPTLLSVEDTERGRQLEVTWEAVTDPDVVRYHVLYGLSSGNYTAGEKTVGALQTSTIISGLTDGQRYYVVVRAAHCSAQGPNSNELSAVPHTVKGVNPPGTVEDLRVLRSGESDLELRWTNPTESVWGTDVTLSAIEVHGSQSGPDFAADGSNLLVTLGADATSWIHAGQGTTAAPRWYYLVIAVDDEARSSAAGFGYPEAVSDLRVTRIDAGTLELAWSRVSTSTRGTRMNIVRYNVYGRDSILPRTEASLSTLLTQVAETGALDPDRSATLPLPGEAVFSYQVLAEETHGNESVW